MITADAGLKVGDHIEAKNAGWSFSGDTPKHFDMHVAKSVPLYMEGHDLVVRLSDYFLSHGSICYEVGCSTGELTRKIYEHNAFKQVQAIGIDNEMAMIEFANCKRGADGFPSFVCADIAEMDLKPCDLIVCYYTMQFIRPRIRQQVVNKFFEALNWGGALLVFEKVRACDARFQDILSGLYVDYKLEKGFNAEEIISKSRSLKGVLEPFSSNGNIDLFKRAGFQDIISVMKYICFEGFLCIK